MTRSVSISQIDDVLFRCRGESAVLDLCAPSVENVRDFLTNFDPAPIGYHNRWEIGRQLVKYRVDWPLWHEVHTRVHAQLREGVECFNPWEHAEASGVPNISPMSFQRIYDGMHITCPREVDTYFVKSWHSREIIEIPNPLEQANSEFDDFLFFKRCGATSPANEAPLEFLVRFAKRSEYKFAYSLCSVKLPRSNREAAAFLLAAGDNSIIAQIFRSAPRWQSALILHPPIGTTWGEFQDFRYLLKGMASDIAAFYNGFRLFTPTDQR